MGRFLLIVGLLAAATLLTACDMVERDPGDPHADLSCAACHQGPTGERGRAMVPEATCTSAGCHGDRGPAEVRFATVTFPHRDHAPGAAVDLTCSGCHTHDGGEHPIRASVDACALCHLGQLTGAESQQCRLCHQDPDHSLLTSQGVAVSHSQLPWIEIGCVRCHYDLASPEVAVPVQTCRQCHDRLERLQQRAVGRDMHPIHSGLTCTACHEGNIHHMEAMSSAVDLVCADCHVQAHEVPLAIGGRPPSAFCSDCHAGVHAPQQQLLLGIRPDGRTMPAEHFVAGITCRSCHIATERTAAEPTVPLRGQATACASCHEVEYQRVLRWWIDGVNERVGSSSRYIDTAARQLAQAPDTAVHLIRVSREMVALVAEAGGHHNLELSDRLMREAVAQVQQAYRLAGQPVPAPPDLGRVPHSGLCSYCHYDPREPWNFEAMAEDFHERVLRIGQ
jgi:hypothetical protein